MLLVECLLVGQHGQFEEARKRAEQAHAKCSIAVVLTNAGNPLRRGDVESHFKDELSKK